jgi:hypothetical protein
VRTREVQEPEGWPASRERIYLWSTFDTQRHARWYFRPVGPGLRFWELFKFYRLQSDRDFQCSADTVSGNDSDMTYLASKLRELGFEFVDNLKEAI